MDAAERKEILSRYMDHQRRFDAVAAKRQNGNAEVIPFAGPLRELEQQPTMLSETEVLLAEARDRGDPSVLLRILMGAATTRVDSVDASHRADHLIE